MFLATLPGTLPFVLVDDPRRALWSSQGIAIASLFLAGRSLGKPWDRPSRVGLARVAVGIALVAAALALGG
jgi:VIT1/CCC1 family predicted Fe2+/Mn2+ transporter